MSTGSPARIENGLIAIARRGAVWIWAACVLVAAVVTVRTHYVADLSAFLPSTPSAEQAVLLDQLKSGVAARLVLMAIEGGTPAQRSNASLQFAKGLRANGEFDAVHNGDNSAFEATGKFLFDHRYLLSPAVDAQRFTAEGLRAGINEATSLLGTPAGSLIKAVILRDPTGETVRMAESMLPAQAPRSDGQVWLSRDGSRAVLIATTHADGADLDAQERTLQSLRASFTPFEAKGSSSWSRVPAPSRSPPGRRSSQRSSDSPSPVASPSWASCCWHSAARCAPCAWPCCRLRPACWWASPWSAACSATCTASRSASAPR